MSLVSTIVSLSVSKEGSFGVTATDSEGKVDSLLISDTLRERERYDSHMLWSMAYNNFTPFLLIQI